MVSKALQGLFWVGKAQHDKYQGLSNGTKSIAKGYCGLGMLNITNVKGFQMQGLLWVGKAQHDKHQGLCNGTTSVARAIVGWESST
jgi:hypothetical protein